MKWALPLGVLLAVAFVVTCSAPAAAQAVPLTGTGGSVPVKGHYQPLRIDEVGTVTLKDGRLVVRGSFESVTIDLPPFVDTARVVRHWALVTESLADNGRKVLNFTHDESLEDFTIDVPATDAEIRYGVFANRSGGGDVMVLTWGREARCYWAYLVIGPPSTASPAGR
jgi:hypothetical protein